MTRHHPRLDYPASWSSSPLSHILFSLHTSSPQPRATHTDTAVPPRSRIQTCLCPIRAYSLGALPSKTHSKRGIELCEHLLSLLFIIQVIILFRVFLLNLGCKLHFIVSMSTGKEIVTRGVLWERAVCFMERAQALERENPSPYPCCGHSQVATYFLRNAMSSSITSR